MEWSEYLSSVVKQKITIDSVALTNDGLTLPISPIVKASIIMLEDMISGQGSCNVFVFPDISQFSKEFLLGKVVYNITTGKIQMSYDPGKFEKGQILKYKDCFVEFNRIEEDNGRPLIYVKFSDGMISGLPIDIAPYFQASESKRLSSYERFKKNYSIEEAIKASKAPEHNVNLLETLENHRTHLNGSIFYVSSISATREYLTSAEFNGKKVTDILYLAHAGSDGDLKNLSAGQLSGNPAIILASDLYSVQNCINKGIIPQSIIVNVSQDSVVEKQLDAFDDLGRKGFPIVCITDTARSFELSPLVERGYNLWRWDSESITDAVITPEAGSASKRVINCAKHSVSYRSVADGHISKTVSLLYKQKSGINDQPPRIISVYDKLFSLSFLMLRSVVPLEQEDKENYQRILQKCISEIEDEKRFMGAEQYSDLSLAANTLLPVFESHFVNNKYEAICDIVLSNEYNTMCLIIPERYDRQKCEKYWETLDLPIIIEIMYPMEYHETPEHEFDIVILVGWLGNKVMRQVIYGFSSKNYMVLTYPCEESWKNAHKRSWKKALDNSGNGEIIKRSFNKGRYQVSTSRFEHMAATEQDVPAEDELEEIELVIRANKFRQYGNGATASEIVEAYPISFVGGYLAFFRTGHKALVATDIIVSGGDKVTNKLPEKLEVGDYLVIRDSEQDIVRDLADRILAREGKSSLRSLALKWKESLSIEALFSTHIEIYEKLCLHGCKKDFITVKNWILSEDLIQPNDKEDLMCIALSTGDDVLKERLEEIHEAGREVRAAHIQAGRILSQRLKNNIGNHMRNLGEIDTFNVWDPIVIQLEDVGQVQILKIIDVNDAIPVDFGNTNRLLAE